MDGPPFLHAAHQVRNAFDGLRVASWLAIGLGIGALIVTWGRLLAWIRTPEPRAPSLRRWGQDEQGWYFEIEGGAGQSWRAEAPPESSALVATEDGLFRPEALSAQPASIISSAGVRLRL